MSPGHLNFPGGIQQSASNLARAVTGNIPSVSILTLCMHLLFKNAWFFSGYLLVFSNNSDSATFVSDIMDSLIRSFTNSHIRWRMLRLSNSRAASGGS